MKKSNLALRSVLADFFINSSVFWFGVAFIGPAFPGIDPADTTSLLTEDILAGILSLLTGYRLRKDIL